jgi:hypothetical protein
VGGEGVPFCRHPCLVDAKVRSVDGHETIV